MSASYEIALKKIPLNTFDNKSVNIGLSNGLVSSGNKSLSVLIVTQVYVAIWLC